MQLAETQVKINGMKCVMTAEYGALEVHFVFVL